MSQTGTVADNEGVQGTLVTCPLCFGTGHWRDGSLARQPDGLYQYTPASPCTLCLGFKKVRSSR